LPELNSCDAPTAKQQIGSRIQIRAKVLPAPIRQVVLERADKAIASHIIDIAVVGVFVEPVQDGGTVFRGQRRRHGSKGI
jgi:hypothetical protein